MTKNTFIGYFFTSLIITAFLIFFLNTFGELPLPIIHIGTILLFTSFAFPSKLGMKGIRLLDEREKFLALKILGISTYVLLIILLLISSYPEINLFNQKLSLIWGHFVFPIFLIVLSVVGFIIMLKEEK